MMLPPRGPWYAFPIVLALTIAPLLRAQIPVNFSTADAGESKGIPNWGLDTNWADVNNMKRGLIFMGRDNVNVVRVPGMVDKPVDNGLTADQKTRLQQCLDLVALASPSAKWDLCAPGSDTVNTWYQSGPGTVSVDRWVQALRLNTQFYNHRLWIVEPFNEPDYAQWGEGSPQNLLDIMAGLQSAPEFSGAAMAGGSTMSTDRATEWFDAVSSRATAGTTHCLYGTVANYVGFIQHVTAGHGLAVNPEGHNVVEAIIGANYGLNTLIWWGTAELARGEFVRASQGVRLGYAEDRPQWTAAAVYRSPAGKVQAFLGGGERVGGSTTYKLHATDRDVYFDGHGPQRDYTVTIARDQERVINITWSPDAPPPIGGRYVIVNRASGLCLEIAGGSTSAGAALQQNAFSGATPQLWDVSPLPASSIGDLSYFLLTNANSALNADVPAWAHDDELVIRQYAYPINAVEHWYFEYVGNGYFVIRSRWSNKCLSIAGSARTPGASVVQRTFSGTPDQLWRLQSPASTSVAVPLRITSQPQSLTGASGQTMTFAVGAVGTGALYYQWQFNGAPITGATNERLVLTDARPANSGAYSAVVSDANATATSSTVTLTISPTTDVGRITNLSIRSSAGTGDGTLIAGFGIGGPGGAKPVLVRAIGPTLSSFGVNGALAAPTLSLFGSAGLLQTGTAWGGSASLRSAFTAVGAFALDTASQDAAFLPTLPAGTYTAQVTGPTGITGIALVELYDATPAGTFDVTRTPRLINASARTQVGTGDGVLIAGFGIAGSTARTVLIRATGPALATFGVSGTLAAPRLDLIKDGITIATNQGWNGDPQISSAGSSVGAFGLVNPASRDSALLVTLSPGTYSAKVSGADNGTGIALVEVYDVP